MSAGRDGQVSGLAAIVAGLSLALGGCSGSAPETSWTGSVVDSAGVVVVISPDEGLWGEADEWRVVEELRIGDFTGDPRYQFGQIGSVAVNSAGHLLVVDRQSLELREFDTDGEHVRTIGTPGQGPGEFARGVADVFVGPGDTLLVPDTRNRRIHRFSPTGAFLDAAPIDVAAYRPLRYRWSPGARTAVSQIRSTRVLSQADAEVQDELREIRPDGSLGRTLLMLPAGDLLGPEGTLRYFSPEPAWALTDSLTVVYGVNDQYRIGVYDTNGALRRIIARTRTPRPISDRDIRAFFAYLDRAWLSAGVPAASLQENHRRVSYAEHFPAFAAIHTGPEGTVWVQPVRAPGDMSDEEIERYNFIEDFGASEWDVYGTGGRFLGVVTMPPRFQPRLFVDDAIYGVQRDELDVQYLVRVRVVTP